MHRCLIAIGAWALLASAAMADQVAITNNIDVPVFKIYAWPTALVARTFNVLGAPLFPNSTAEIDVDNAYGDCDFTFQYDPNNPDDLKRANYRRKPLLMYETNICNAKDKINIDTTITDGDDGGTTN